MEEKKKIEPIQVIYCGQCGLPPEYCEYNKKSFKKCKIWMKENAPEVYEKLDAELKESKNDAKEIEEQDKKDKLEQEKKQNEEESKEQEKDDKKKKKHKKQKNTKQGEGEEITVAVSKRMGKKRITIIMGLLEYGISVKDVSGKCKKRFACSASVLENKHVEIQGDVANDVAAWLCKEYKQLNENMFTIKEYEQVMKKPTGNTKKGRLQKQQQAEETEGMPDKPKDDRELPSDEDEEEKQQQQDNDSGEDN